MTDSFDPAHEAPLVSPWTPSLEQHAATVERLADTARKNIGSAKPIDPDVVP